MSAIKLSVKNSSNVDTTLTVKSMVEFLQGVDDGLWAIDSIDEKQFVQLCPDSTAIVRYVGCATICLGYPRANFFTFTTAKIRHLLPGKRTVKDVSAMCTRTTRLGITEMTGYFNDFPCYRLTILGKQLYNTFYHSIETPREIKEMIANLNDHDYEAATKTTSQREEAK